MKLEPKHLAPYLPYELNLEGISVIGPRTFKGIDLSIPNGPHVLDLNGHAFKFTQIKPILRPLSDLQGMEPKFDPKATDHPINIVSTKTIIEVEGAIHNGHANLIVLWITYDQMDKLIEYHFDVFGLIEKGLAIDINTIEKP